SCPAQQLLLQELASWPQWQSVVQLLQSSVHQHPLVQVLQVPTTGLPGLPTLVIADTASSTCSSGAPVETLHPAPTVERPTRARKTALNAWCMLMACILLLSNGIPTGRRMPSSVGSTWPSGRSSTSAEGHVARASRMVAAGGQAPT